MHSIGLLYSNLLCSYVRRVTTWVICWLIIFVVTQISSALNVIWAEVRTIVLRNRKWFLHGLSTVWFRISLFDVSEKDLVPATTPWFACHQEILVPGGSPRGVGREITTTRSCYRSGLRMGSCAREARVRAWLFEKKCWWWIIRRLDTSRHSLADSVRGPQAAADRVLRDVPPDG